MSIVVDLDQLGVTLTEYGPGYLLTTGTDGRVKAVTVEPDLIDEVFDLPPSRGSGRNLSGNPLATLVFPPPAPRGYTLIVDGTAAVTADGIRFTPETAVLHRPADHADGPPPTDGCGHDCRPL